jgi:hypothetical protein
VTASLIPLLPLFIVVLTAVWVYTDARHHVAEGSPPVLRIGALTIDTPAAWLGGSVVLWIFFFPMYLVSRSRS